MKIVCIGGGPAGLYFGAADEDAQPGARHHRGRAQQALRHLRLGRGVLRRDHGQHAPVGPGHRRRDPAGLQPLGRHRAGLQGPKSSARAATALSASAARSCSTSCRARCEELGVKLVFETDVNSDEEFPDADLIIASDGINSRIRTKYAAVFKPDIVLRPNRFIWLGTNKLYDAFTFAVREDRARLVPGAHLQVRREHHHLHRRDARSMSGRRTGLDLADQEESIAFCEKLFAKNLQGAKLMTNARHLRGSAWINFQRVKCEQWSLFNGKSHVVLMGDAVHTAHFAIGSGTKLAIEDAIELTRLFVEMGDTAEHIPEVLARYQEVRGVEVLQAAERRLERDGVVRGLRRALLRPLRAAAVHVLDAHAQPAHQPREPAPARRGLAGRLRGAGSPCRRGRRSRCRRCSRRSRCAASR